jgi:hypothetical protein
MRALVVLSSDLLIRNFLTTGAFGGLREDETFYVTSSSGVAHTASEERLAELKNYLGSVQDPRPGATRSYRFLRQLLFVSLRRRSQTMAIKTSMLPARKRWKLKLLALPGVRRRVVARALASAGSNSQLRQLMAEIKPDLVIIPTGGYETLVWDALGSARELEVPSLVLVHNWDNLSSKGVFAVTPDYVGVWGDQSAEHATRIHGIDPSRVVPVGSPSLDPYFRHVPGTAPSPFPFRYALFAGCFAPFDELDALRRLEQVIEAEGLDIKVVYRPHPHRRLRHRSDLVNESDFRHVVIDPQMRETYLASFDEGKPGHSRPRPIYPPLDYYPALFEHCEFVVCPLSTMIVEAAIFGRRVVVLAYDDGIHDWSPATVVEYDHFAGVESVPGFAVCRSVEAMIDAFMAEALRDRTDERRRMRAGVAWWLHHDERTYGERVVDLAERVVRSHRPSGLALGAGSSRAQVQGTRMRAADG